MQIHMINSTADQRLQLFKHTEHVAFIPDYFSRLLQVPQSPHQTFIDTASPQVFPTELNLQRKVSILFHFKSIENSLSDTALLKTSIPDPLPKPTTPCWYPLKLLKLICLQ